jgi:hypothetical protein
VLRTSLAKAHIKRTFRPLYGWDQMTPKSQFLDAAWDRSVPIFPGMVMMKTVGENVSLLDGTGHPYGFSGLYIGGDGIDEVLDSGINATAVWVMAADAEAEVLAGGFDNTQDWTEPVNGTIKLVHASTTGANRGKLVPAGAANASARPVARLIKTVSAQKIIIGGLAGTQ